MIHRSRFFTLVCLTTLSASAGCAGGPDADPSSSATVFMGARLIDGTGAPPIDDAVLVVDGERIVSVGARNTVEIPDGAQEIDLGGHTLMPALVNTHAHLANDRAERLAQLEHMAYYGAGLVVSLGHDEGDMPLSLRSERLADAARSMSAGRGITRPEPGRSEVPYWIDTQEEARAAVQELAAANVDFVKIWVDDRNGRYPKLTPELYGAVIEEAHELGLRVTAHIFTLEDAKGVLRAGVDAFAHGIRDQDVDDELVALWQERPDVVLVPNLPGAGVAQDLSWLGGTVPPERLAEMQASSTDRPAAQEAFGIQARNLVRLHDAGIPVAFGTDGSSPWAVHQEMEDMVRAGLSASDVIVAATATSAEFLGADDLGTLTAGKSADFLVLSGDPLADITQTREIVDVYLRGTAVDRERVRQQTLGIESP